MKACCIFFLGFLMLAACQTPSYIDKVKTPAQVCESESQIDVFIAKMLPKYRIQKLSVSVISDGRIAYSRRYNMIEDELIQAASIGKALTAYAAMQLVEQGKLELDRPLNEYLGASFFSENSPGTKITLRMVLSHTSGMGNDLSGSVRQIYYEPGKSFHYSGAGFKFLMKVIENITSMPFDAYMENVVMKLLGMSHSRFSIPLRDGRRQWSSTSITHGDWALDCRKAKDKKPSGIGETTATSIRPWQLSSLSKRQELSS